jgi:hypothetical protein
MVPIIRRVASAICFLIVTPICLGQEPPKPGPEFDHLKNLVGTWDAAIKFSGGESKGTMTYKMELGGLWLVGAFEGEFGGQKFEGRGLDSFDNGKKKYVSVWVDSMTTTPMITEGTYDKDSKTMTMAGESPGQDGKPTKVKTITTVKDKDHLEFVMFMGGKEGKGEEMMTINYTRKK